MDGFNNAYKDKVVLITGHTGFKGSWLSIWLHELGAKVIGYSLNPYTERDNFVLSGIGNKITDIRGDIRDRDKLNQVFNDYKPEFVFHMAAQSLVRLSYKKPIETYETNVMGTINVLEAIRNCDNTRVGIMITTDKCYENKEQIWGYREIDSMGGYDPYSSSKGCAELVISSWRNSFMNSKDYNIHKKSISSVRAGNVIGGGDWSKNRIIPDCIKALEDNFPIKIRNPQSIRPWEHVLEPLSGYLLLGEKMYKEPIKYSGAWNFGPNSSSMVTVWDIANKIIENYGSGQLMDISNPNDIHEANLLLLDITKARSKLGWKPVLDVDEMIDFTVDWYENYKSKNVYNMCKKQIIAFMKKGEII